MAVGALRTHQYLYSIGLPAFVPTNVVSENKSASKSTRTPASDTSSQEPRTDGDSTLASFEAVMKAMDDELSRARRTQTTQAEQNTANDKGKDKDVVDIEAAMEAELRSALEQEEDLLV